jgi:hypothetical protein
MRDSKKTKKESICTGMQAQAQGKTDPGLSKRIRDVGLIQDPKDLDQTAGMLVQG